MAAKMLGFVRGSKPRGSREKMPFVDIDTERTEPTQNRRISGPELQRKSRGLLRNVEIEARTKRENYRKLQVARDNEK